LDQSKNPATPAVRREAEEDEAVNTPPPIITIAGEGSLHGY
jgi:hypothetical protein